MHDTYTFLEELGRGAYGTVCRAQHKRTNVNYAVKHINKSAAGEKGMQTISTEVETLMTLNHPNVVKLEDVYEDANHVWIVWIAVTTWMLNVQSNL